jgi:hypothetical protein
MRKACPRLMPASAIARSSVLRFAGIEEPRPSWPLQFRMLQCAEATRLEMIRKSVKRFSEKIMLNQQPKAR